jgi:hypothetical protein
MPIDSNSGGASRVIFANIKGKVQTFTDHEGRPSHGAINIKYPDGALETLRSGRGISGVLTKVAVRTNLVDGEEVNSLQMTLDDPKGVDPRIVASVNVASYYGAKIVGAINAAPDLRQPISIAVNTVKAGEKIGDQIWDKDSVFPVVKQNDVRLVPVWANGATELPEAPQVKVSGKMIKDMEPVNQVIAETVGELIGRLESLRNTQDQGDDDGISAEDLAEAARQASQERSRG